MALLYCVTLYKRKFYRFFCQNEACCNLDYWNWAYIYQQKSWYLCITYKLYCLVWNKSNAWEFMIWCMVALHFLIVPLWNIRTGQSIEHTEYISSSLKCTYIYESRMANPNANIFLIDSKCNLGWVYCLKS